MLDESNNGTEMDMEETHRETIEDEKVINMVSTLSGSGDKHTL